MKVITFNSYKGGACRTTTCYNTLPYLAKELGATSEEPILVFDIDLDSMGLTNIFNSQADRSDDRERAYSAKHLFVDDNNGINSRLHSDMLDSVNDEWYFKYFTKVGNDLGLADNGSVLFCGADENSSTISDDDYERFKESPPLVMLLNAFRDMNPAPKAVVFDCAAGVQMSTLMTLCHMDYSVMCMRPTMQFRIGTSNYLIKKIPIELKKNNTGQNRTVVLLPTSVAQINIPESDNNRETAIAELNKLRRIAFAKIKRDIIEKYYSNGRAQLLGYVLNTEMAEGDDVIGIPEIERFKWEEGLLHNMEELTDQEKLLKTRYAKLAKIISK